MEGVYFMLAIIGGELGLVALVTWFVMQLRGTGEAEARGRLAELEREEEELKKAA